MPRYDYQCESCSHQFEVRQSFSSEPVASCPLCESASKRQFHSVPIMFKGSGWYVNDYGKKAGSGGSSSDPKDAESKSSKSESEVDSTTKSSTGEDSASTPDSTPSKKSTDKVESTSTNPANSD